LISREFWQKCERERTNYEKYLPPNTDIARKWVKWLYLTYDLTWKDLSEFLGVPVGTLHGFAHGRKLPHKYKRNLGIHYDRKLHDMPTKELRWSIENRTDM
jgi:hypothetical protein